MNFEKCRKCANAGHTYVCAQCGGRFNHFEPIKPKTNADHIRSMTDEELAWRMMQLNFCPPNIDEYKVCGKDANCHQCWVDWLKQPFDGGDT